MLRNVRFLSGEVVSRLAGVRVEGAFKGLHGRMKRCDLETLAVCDAGEISLRLSTLVFSSVNGNTACLERL